MKKHYKDYAEPESIEDKEKRRSLYAWLMDAPLDEIKDTLEMQDKYRKWDEEFENDSDNEQELSESESGAKEGCDADMFGDNVSQDPSSNFRLVLRNQLWLMFRSGQLRRYAKNRVMNGFWSTFADEYNDVVSKYPDLTSSSKVTALALSAVHPLPDLHNHVGRLRCLHQGDGCFDPKHDDFPPEHTLAALEKKLFGALQEIIYRPLSYLAEYLLDQLGLGKAEAYIRNLTFEEVIALLQTPQIWFQNGWYHAQLFGPIYRATRGRQFDHSEGLTALMELEDVDRQTERDSLIADQNTEIPQDGRVDQRGSLEGHRLTKRRKSSSPVAFAHSPLVEIVGDDEAVEPDYGIQEVHTEDEDFDPIESEDELISESASSESQSPTLGKRKFDSEAEHLLRLEAQHAGDERPLEKAEAQLSEYQRALDIEIACAGQVDVRLDGPIVPGDTHSDSSATSSGTMPLTPPPASTPSPPSVKGGSKAPTAISPIHTTNIQHPPIRSSRPDLPVHSPATPISLDPLDPSYVPHRRPIFHNKLVVPESSIPYIPEPHLVSVELKEAVMDAWSRASWKLRQCDCGICERARTIWAYGWFE